MERFSTLRAYSLTLALLVSALAICAAMLFAQSHPTSTGLHVWIARKTPCRGSFATVRTLVLSVRPNGLYFNQDLVPDGKVQEELREIMKYRAEKVLFFQADRDVEYGRAVEALSLAATSTHDLEIGIIPQNLERPPIGCYLTLPESASSSE